MSLIQNPTTSRKLQRGFRLTELPDGILAPEIVGVVLLEDWSAPLSDIERGCMGAADITAAVAENSIIALVRVGAPARYGLTVSRIWFSTATTQVIQVIVPTAGVTGLTVSGDTNFTDLNLPGRPSSQLGSDSAAAIPAGRIIFSQLIQGSVLTQLDVALRIGTFGVQEDLTSIIIVATNTNTRLLGGFEWTESEPEG